MLESAIISHYYITSHHSSTIQSPPPKDASLHAQNPRATEKDGNPTSNRVKALEVSSICYFEGWEWNNIEWVLESIYILTRSHTDK